ncbi:MAG TPA: alpha/beta fold hydrolase [Devosiaceae bacterium]
MADGNATLAPQARQLWWNVATGGIFGLAAMLAAPLVGLKISADLGNTDGRTTWLTLFAGVFLMACLFAFLLMFGPRRFSAGRGAITGILTAFFSYPVVLTLADIVHRNWGDSADLPALSERFDNILLVTGLTLMTTGFAATLILAAVGMLAGWALSGLAPGRSALSRQPPSRPPGTLLKVTGGLAVALVAFLVGSFIWLSLLPLDTADIALHQTAGTPAQTYPEAIAAFEVVQAQEAKLPLHDRCHSTLLTHGSKVTRVVIYFHGFTSCPAQGDELAARLFALGYNVYLPRMFGHGEADPTTMSLKDLTAEHLIDLGNSSIDMAQGLGDEVVVIGLSAGGTIASWAAQYRGDVDNAIAVSPFFGPYVAPPWANHAVTNLTLMLPNFVLWWNPLENVAPQPVDYAFALPATHALAEIMLLGSLVDASARTTPPAAKNIGVLLNAADISVSNALTEQVITSWQGHGTAVTVKTLSFSSHLPHDLINPRERGGDIDLVYSTLLEMMNDPGLRLR